MDERRVGVPDRRGNWMEALITLRFPDSVIMALADDYTLLVLDAARDSDHGARQIIVELLTEARTRILTPKGG